MSFLGVARNEEDRIFSEAEEKTSSFQFVVSSFDRKLIEGRGKRVG